MARWIDPLTVDDGADPLWSALMTGADDPSELVARWLRRPAWHRDSACRGQGTDLFFPERGHTPAAGIDVCSTCSVVALCAQAGADESHGTWGGMTVAQRRQGRTAAA